MVNNSAWRRAVKHLGAGVVAVGVRGVQQQPHRASGRIQLHALQLPRLCTDSTAGCHIQPCSGMLIMTSAVDFMSEVYLALVDGMR